MRQAEVRSLRAGDWPAFELLERSVWERDGVETTPLRVFEDWLQSNFFFGAFRGSQILGYVYGESIYFSPDRLPGEHLESFLLDYKRKTPTVSNPNTLHGVSMVAHGTGQLLLGALTKNARDAGLTNFVSLARLYALGSYVDSHKKLADFSLWEVATHYAIQSVIRVGGLVEGSLANWTRADFPPVIKPDPVVSRFAKYGKKLMGVYPTSFADPRGLGYSALMFMNL